MQIINFLTNLDINIYVYLGLLLFLVVGILFKDKPKNIQDYALGVKPFSMPTLVATMAATLIGGGTTIGDATLYYNEGLLLMFPLVIGYLAYIFFAHYILPKLDKYYGEVSIASINARIYGASVERVTGIVAYMYCFGAYAMQIKAVGIVIEYALGYNSLFATSLSFLVITAYSAFGGVRSVIRTDVVQFLIFMVVLPTVAIFLLKENGGVYAIFKKTSWKTNDNFNLMSYVSLFIFSLAPKIYPMFIHRLLIGRDRNKEIIYFTVLIQIICSLFAIIVASVAISKYQGGEGNLIFLKTTGDVIKNNFLHALFTMAMLAVILSSADSLINTGAIIFVENIIKNKIKDDSVKLLIVKIITAISGFLGLFIALKITSLLSIILFFAQYYSVTLLIPFLGGLFVKNANSLMFWTSSITGFISYTLLKLLVPEIEHTAYVISLFMSFIAFLLAKYFSKRGIINVREVLKRMESFTESIIKQMNIPINKLSYAIIPISIFTLFTDIISNEINTDTIVFKLIAGLIGLSFIFIDRIFMHSKRIVRNCYVLLAIWYCFPFLSSYLYYTLPDSNVAFANMVVSCTLLAVIFSSQILVVFMSIGALSGSLAFIILKPIKFSTFIPQALILTLIVLYVGVISYFILRTKEVGIKKFISDLTKETLGEGNKKSSIILNEYSKVIEVIKRHEKAKEFFLEKRSEFRGYAESDDIITANVDELVEKLNDYMSLIGLEKEIKFNIKNAIKNITITKPVSMIYTIVFSIAYYMLKFNEKVININVTSRNKKLYIKYTLPNLKLKIEEIKKYVQDLNRPEGIMSFELVKKIINKQDDMEIIMSTKAITLTISIVVSEVMEKNTRFIDFSSQESNNQKVLN